MKDYEILESAAEYIEQHGWHQGSIVTDDGSVCTLGAMYGVIGVLGTDLSGSVVGGILAPYILLSSFLGEKSIPIWNDTEGRTEQEVLDALQKAAKLGHIREDCEMWEGTNGSDTNSETGSSVTP